MQADSLLYNWKIPNQEEFIRSSRYLQVELPVRLSHRVKVKDNNFSKINVSKNNIKVKVHFYKKSFIRLSICFLQIGHCETF